MTLELITVALVATMLILQIAVFFTMQKDSKETNERIDQIEDAEETYDDRFEEIDTKVTDADKQINEIITKLETITADIGRLDAMDFGGQLNSLQENVKQIEHDEKEIRAYYVNFRDPVEHNAGVTWAAAYPTYEEDLEEAVS